MQAIESWIASQSEARDSQQLKRRRRVLSSPQSPLSTIDGDPKLSFSSNDYLGLASNSEIANAAKSALDQYGFGAGASHMVVGHHVLHEQLENDIAEFVNRDRALVFSSGYLANLAVITSFADKDSLLLQDKLNHASLIDGGQLSKARMQRYLHSDAQSLRAYLERYADIDRKVVVTDGVFSMDGDVAPLNQLSAICRDSGSLLCVDDAHGLGVLGPQGIGAVGELNLSAQDVPILIGTFGKAFGTCGAFVAGDSELIEHLEQVGRPYIYTTASPPATAAATIKSVELVRQADDRRAHLMALIRYFRKEAMRLGAQLNESETPIQPVLLGSNEQALRAESLLEDAGIVARAIRPPTVPHNTARLRITLTASHTFEQVERLLEALGKVV